MTLTGKNARNAALSLISGVLGFAAFPPFEISFLAWISFVPLFFVLRNGTTKKNFLYSYLTGCVFFGGLLYWLPNVTVPGTVILVLILALFYGVFGVFVGMLLRYSINLFIMSFFWVILEYIRAHLFTGFPWGLLGHSQYLNINLIQLADIMGVYGISFIVMTFNAGVFSYLSRSKRRVSYLMISVLFIVVAVIYGRYRLDNFRTKGSIRASVIQGNIPQRMKWEPGAAEDILGIYSSLTESAAAGRPDIIVWPETAYPYLAVKGEEAAPEIAELSSELRIPVLAGLVYEENGKYYNSAVFFDNLSERHEIYRKLHLVPFGEYVPFERYLGRFREHIDKPIGDFSRGDEYALFTLRSLREFVGDDGTRTRSTAFHDIGVLICFEDLFPYLSREFVIRGARILLNITNDAWFGDTAAARQHMQSSVFRAVENRVPVIRAANTGISCFIDATGKIISEVNEGGRSTFVRGYDTRDIEMSAERSYYTVYGDTFVYFSVFMLVIFLVLESITTPRPLKK